MAASPEGRTVRLWAGLYAIAWALSRRLGRGFWGGGRGGIPGREAGSQAQVGLADLGLLPQASAPPLQDDATRLEIMDVPHL